MSQQTHQPLDVPERRYDAEADRLFLVYYALPPGFNRNKWGVRPTSIDANIQSAVNKPVVVYRKNPNNRFHTKQAGSYVHPTPEEAGSELGHYPKASEYFQWQERFAVGRIRSVDKRDKGHAWTLEITDPEVKNILKSDEYKTGIPGWTSPQIMFQHETPDEIYDKWLVSHVALVDVPAYGYDQAGVRAKCLGVEEECTIKTRSASEENLGFCVKQATIGLVESRKGRDTIVDNLRTIVSAHSANQDMLESIGVLDSSLSSKNATANNITMSESQITGQPTASGQTVTFNPPTVTTTDTTNTQPPVNKSSTEPEQPEPVKPDNGNQPDKEETERLASSNNEPKSLQEAQTMVRQMSELLRETNKQLKNQGKELETIRAERKQARLSYIIPRDLFKTDESHLKEVQKTMNENISEQWLVEYWKTKRELAMAQTTGKRMVVGNEEPLVAKSASSSQNGHDVPDFSSSQNPNRTSNVQKTLELQRRILEGGVI